MYEDLLRHLSVTFQGGNDEANILAKFYSHSQCAKELEEVFADELQLLAWKVISKKPDFQVNLDTILKQWYTNQLYNCNSASIAKMLLLQMPKVSFTQFRNELARVFGTHQHSSKLLLSPLQHPQSGLNLKRRGLFLNPSISKDKKVSAQSSQIKDLCTKLDGSIAKNAQIQELFNPASLQMALTNALQAAQSGATGKNSNNTHPGKKPFLGEAPGTSAFSWEGQ